jgi:predicted 2-oxoglutarate/Fe(II)-dependent dioxygenase YbiX
VRAGQAAPGQSDSGVLRLADPRTGANAYRDPANQRLHPPFALRPVELRLAAGQLVVFPSYLFHDVSPFYGSDTRITVATNCWFAE